MPPWERGSILKRAADLLRANADAAARSLTLEQGKPLAEARSEVMRSAEFLEWGGEQARRIGKPGAARAVGAANGKNPIWIVIPCHRVLGVSGSLTGYAGGVAAKKFLLELERATRS